MYKLYEIYDEEQDIFFHDTCCYNSMYEIEEYKKMCEQFSEIMLLDTERLMRRAFKSVWLTNGNELSEKQCVGLLLLFVPYITTNSLYELRFFDTLEQASSWLSHSVFSEKNKRGFLRSFPTGCTNIRKAYTLTAAARENLLEALPKKYVETSIRTSDAALTKLNCHNAFCCHLYYWFLSEYEFPYFEWYSAPFFDDNFSFLENVEKTNGKAALVPKNSTGFRPDAFVKTLQKQEHYYFIEQDMCTEKPIRIQEKFQRYVKLLATMPQEELPFVSIIFSVFIDSPDLSMLNASEIRRVKKTSTIASIKRNCDNVQLYVDTLSTVQNNITVSDVFNSLIQSMQTCQDKKMLNKYTKMYELLSDFLDTCETNTIDDLKSYMEKIIEKAKEEKKQDKRLLEHTAFLSRKKGVENAVSELSEMQQFFLDGMRFVQIKTFSAETLKLVFLYEYRTEILEKSLLPALMDKLPLSGEYEIHDIAKIGTGTDEYIFLNHVIFRQNPSQMVFENISNDLGARFRVKRFLQDVTTFPDGFLYIVLLVSSLEDAYDANKNLLGAGQSIARRCAPPGKATVALSNILVLYVCSEPVKDMPKFTPFALTQKNKIEKF